jgi:hypothetical protein
MMQEANRRLSLQEVKVTLSTAADGQPIKTVKHETYLMEKYSFMSQKYNDSMTQINDYMVIILCF